MGNFLSLIFMFLKWFSLHGFLIWMTVTWTHIQIFSFLKKLFFSLDPRLFRKLSIFCLRNATNLTLRTFSGVHSWILYLLRNYILHNWNVLFETSFFNVQRVHIIYSVTRNIEKFWSCLILQILCLSNISVITLWFS